MSDEKVTHKYGGQHYIPGIPARDLTQEDLDGFDEAETELLRRDAERETPLYKHSKNLGHSEQFKENAKREKAEKAASKKEE